MSDQDKKPTPDKGGSEQPSFILKHEKETHRPRTVIMA